MRAVIEGDVKASAFFTNGDVAIKMMTITSWQGGARRRKRPRPDFTLLYSPIGTYPLGPNDFIQPLPRRF